MRHLLERHSGTFCAGQTPNVGALIIYPHKRFPLFYIGFSVQGIFHRLFSIIKFMKFIRKTPLFTMGI